MVFLYITEILSRFFFVNTKHLVFVENHRFLKDEIIKFYFFNTV